MPEKPTGEMPKEGKSTESRELRINLDLTPTEVRLLGSAFGSATEFLTEEARRIRGGLEAAVELYRQKYGSWNDQSKEVLESQAKMRLRLSENSFPAVLAPFGPQRLQNSSKYA